MATIHNSAGETKECHIEECHIEVWEDLSNQSRSQHYRAFWVAPGSNSGCPVVGHCSPGGSWPTIRQVVAECRKLGYTDPVYRNGRLIDAGV